MSIYLEDAQGKVVSAPINETNTKYVINHNNNDHPSDYQYMYNDGIPVSNIDTDVYDSYRNTTEELRKKTESWNEAMEACLVPYEVEGMAIQPFEYVEKEDDEGNKVQEKIKSLQYFFQDHPSNIGRDSKEFVFRTNKVHFLDDRHRRLIYDRKIHLLSLKEDEDNKVTFLDVIMRTFYQYYNNSYWCLVRDDSGSNRSSLFKLQAYNGRNNVPVNLLTAILKANTKFNDFSSVRRSTDATTLEVVELDNNGDFIITEEEGPDLEPIEVRQTKVVESIDDLINYPLLSGQDVDTTILSSIYNLYALKWIQACLIFLNGLAIPWYTALISVDNIDTFVIATNPNNSAFTKFLNDTKNIKMEYVLIPFSCIYVIRNENAADSKCPYRDYLDSSNKFRTVPFRFNKSTGGMKSEYLNSIDSSCDRIVCTDPNIIYKQIEMGSISTSDTKYETYLSDLGVNFNLSLKDFCNHDYRTKLKQFNFLGFEVKEYINNEHYNIDKRHKQDPDMTLKNGDYKITWHPFNLLDIRFDNVLNNRRVFKIFYNTKVLYDQDNILRIKNFNRLDEEYKLYREELVGNIETYLNELYILAKKDIGSYTVTNEKVYVQNYKYHYVTPYECFLLYNALQTFLKGSLPDKDHKYDTVTFDNFRNLNIINYPIHTKPDSDGGGGGGSGGSGLFDYEYDNYVYEEPSDDELFEPVTPSTSTSDNKPSPISNLYLGYIDGGFIIYDDDHNFFSDKMIKEEDIYDDQGNLKQEIADFWQSIVDLDERENNKRNLMDFLIPIDDAKYKGDEFHTKGDPSPDNIFYTYSGDFRGVIHPYLKFINGYSLEMTNQEEDTIYDYLKIRFELSYINNMEEGATPVDELIYYFDNNNGKGPTSQNSYPVMSDSDVKNRLTANVLNSLANNIFKYDPNNVVKAITMLNYGATYLIPNSFDQPKNRDNYLMLGNNSLQPHTEIIDRAKDPRYYYNFGYEREGKAIKIASEWGLRRSLPEMFFYSLDKDKYTIDSMHLLDEVFDFTYSLADEENTRTDQYKMYEKNLKHGVNYIIGYDADKLEASIKRGVTSLIRSGKQLKAFMSNHPAKLYTSTDSYKQVKFVTNNEYIVSINRERIFIEFAKNGSTRTIAMGMFNDHGEKVYYGQSSTDVMLLRYKGQVNPTIEINPFNHTIKDIDKNFTATYVPSKTIYNPETEKIEFYNSNDDQIVIMPFDVVYDYSKLQMSRWNISSQENYVMIFKNRELYDKYYTIHYTDITFDVDLDIDDTEDDDMFEFVFFLNANNTIIEKNITTTSYPATPPTSTVQLDAKIPGGHHHFDRAVSCNTSVIPPEDLQLLVNVMPNAPGDSWNVSKTTKTSYEINHGIWSYKQYFSNDVLTTTLCEDTKVNGLYRVTKQGGGEYFITFGTNTSDDSITVDVPEKSDTIISDINTQDEKDTFIDYSAGDDRPTDKGYTTTGRTITTPFTLFLTSKRQFRYYHHTITNGDHDAGFIIDLPLDFRFCTRNGNCLVFHNGRLLPATYYYIRPIINTPLDRPAVCFNVALSVGDIIDVFYVTNALYHVECEWYNKDKRASQNDYQPPYNPIDEVAYSMVDHYVTNGTLSNLYNPDNSVLGTYYYKVMGEGPDVVDYPEKASHIAQDERMANPEYSKSWRTNYIKLHSPLYAISSKHSAFVFLNGKKVRFDELEDITDTIMAINTDYARLDEDMQAARMELIVHLDTQDIIEQLFINDGLSHTDTSYKQDTLKIRNFSLAELESYAKRTLLDDILNDLSDQNLNKLFYYADYNFDKNNNIPKGPMTVRGSVDQFLDNLVPAIEEEFYITGDDDLFIWHTVQSTQSVDGEANTIFYIGDKLYPYDPPTQIKVPVTHDGEHTKALYATTFNRNKTVKTVVIPEGVERIE